MTNYEREWHRRCYEKAKLAYAALMKFYPLTLEDLPGEIWKPIPDWEDYHGSNFGRVKSFKHKTPRIIKPTINQLGYLQITVSKGRKRKSVRIHQLVARTFIPNPENKPQVNHIDGNKLNNFVGNLEWATAKENTKHAYLTGLKKSGEENARAKLTSNQVIYIRENPDGLNTYQLAEMFGVCATKISAVQLGETYKNAGGSLRQPKFKRVPDDLRAQIRAEYIHGSKDFGCYGLARKYAVCPMTIWHIINEVNQ